MATKAVTLAHTKLIQVWEGTPVTPHFCKATTPQPAPNQLRFGKKKSLSLLRKYQGGTRTGSGRDPPSANLPWGAFGDQKSFWGMSGPQCHQAEGPAAGTGDLRKNTEERSEQGRGSPKVPSPAPQGWIWAGGVGPQAGNGAGAPHEVSTRDNSAVTVQGDFGESMTPWVCWRSWFQLESSVWPPQPHVHPPSSSMG